MIRRAFLPSPIVVRHRDAVFIAGDDFASRGCFFVIDAQARPRVANPSRWTQRIFFSLLNRHSDDLDVARGWRLKERCKDARQERDDFEDQVHAAAEIRLRFLTICQPTTIEIIQAGDI